MKLMHFLDTAWLRRKEILYKERRALEFTDDITKAIILNETNNYKNYFQLIC